MPDAPKRADEDELVAVRWQRNDVGKTARVLLANLRDIRLRSDGRRCPPVGELAEVAPRLCLHARIRCDMGRAFGWIVLYPDAFAAGNRLAKRDMVTMVCFTSGAVM